MKTKEREFFEVTDEASFSIDPIERPNSSGHEQKVFLELQLKMATSSINHEYARMEFEDTACSERREELLEYMNNCRSQYFEAREDLEKYDPYALLEFEKDLMRQKSSTLYHYNA